MKARCDNHDKYAGILLFLVVFLILLPAAFAEGEYQPIYNPTLEVSRTAGAIKIDGELDDPGWDGAARAANFCEHRPGDQTRPPVETEAFMTYDDDHLYVAFVCYDDPSTIRASFCDRDRIFSDDNICLLIDTYGDAAWAYELSVNPYGIQGDLLWSKYGGEDDGYDMIWESAGKITDRGYQLEMAIPFSSMRFPNKPQQTWKVDFWRNHPRSSRRQYSWAALDRDEPCWPCQWGTVTGIENVKPGKGIEILPGVIGYQSGELDRDFENDDPDGEFSLSAKYAVSSDITAEATANPDFSQVEADVAQIDVNTTFALLYPERRPFFQEGSDLFNTIFTTVYTRSINDPQVAGKMTARINRTSIAYLVARDEHTPVILPFEESSAWLLTEKSTSNILRARQTIGEDSQVGLILTDRRLDGGGSGTLAGIDGALRFAKNYTFHWQAIGNRVVEPSDTALTTEILEQVDSLFDGGSHTAGFDGESYWGHASYTGIEYDSRHVYIEASYLERSPTFRTDNGFEPKNNQRSGRIFGGYTFFPNSRLFESINPQLSVGRAWNFRGMKKDESITIDQSMQLKAAQINTHTQYMRSAERLGGVWFDDIWSLHQCLHSNISDLLSAGFGVTYGHKIARRELVMGMETSLSAWLEIKPLDRLLIEPEFSFAKSDHLDSGEELFQQFIARTWLNYQFTRELALRLVVQYRYRDVDREREMDRWEVDPLLTYRLNPFSIFYIGSTVDYDDLGVEQGGPEQWRIRSRQFFMKLQYLFQL